MVSKKVVKRKTVWRTLSIGAEAAAAAAGNTNGADGAAGGAADSATATTLTATPAANVVTAATTTITTHPTANINNSSNINSNSSSSSSSNNNSSSGSNHNGATTGGARVHDGNHHHQHHHRTTASSNFHDGRSKPFTPYNRHHSTTSSTSFQSHPKFSRRPSTTYAPTGENRVGAINGPADASVATASANVSDATTPTACGGGGASIAGQPSVPAPRWNGGNRGAISRNERFGTRNAGSGASAGGSAGSGYRRRPFNPRYYNGNTRSTFRIHRTDEASADASGVNNCGDGEKNTTKPLFNEDDYTRITTPRQDVLFKKGYLSRPKPYASSATQSELAAGGTEDVIVLTPEEAIAAGLMHGYDPENPYIGFYDATGMFYVNPYMNNGAIDPYTGQMMMMPYDVAVDSYPSDGCAAPIGDVPSFPALDSCCMMPDDPVEEIFADYAAQSTLSADCAAVEYAVEPLAISSTEQSQNGDEPISTDESQGGATSKGDEGDGEETTPDVTIDGSATDAPTSNIQAFFPQVFYPFVLGAPAPYMPANDIDGPVHPYESSQAKFNRFRRRKRKPFRYPCSTGTTTTTDYSEDEEHMEPNPSNAYLTDNTSIDEVLLLTNLHANVTDFVPREFTTEEYLAPSTPPPSPTPSIVRNTTLNVHVPEFRPRAAALTKLVSSADRDSDDSGVSTIDMQPSASNTPEPPATIIDAAHFPSIGVAAGSSGSSGDDKREPLLATPVAAWSYAAIAQRPQTVSVDSTVPSDEQRVSALTEKITERVEVRTTTPATTVATKPSRHSRNNAGKQVITAAAGKAKSKANKAKNSIKSSPAKCATDDVPPAVLSPEVLAEADTIPAAEVIETKSNGLSFADLLRPAVAVVVEQARVLSAKPVESVSVRTETVTVPSEKKILTAELVQTVTTTAPTWQTIRVKGKKRMVQHVESADFWDEPEPEPPVLPAIVPVVVKPIEVPTSGEDIAQPDDEEAEVQPTETLKTKARRVKSKKPVKKVIIKDICIAEKERKPEMSVAQTKCKALKDNERENEIESNDPEPIELHEYNFVADPNAIFVNAIAPAPTMFGSPRGDKFAVNGGMFGSGKFDFACKSPQASATLRHEEDMVMRIMRSISQVEARTCSGEEIVEKTNGVASVVEVTPPKTIVSDVEVVLKTLTLDEQVVKSVANGKSQAKTVSEITNNETYEIRNITHENGHQNGHDHLIIEAANHTTVVSKPISNGLAANKTNGHPDPKTASTNGLHSNGGQADCTKIDTNAVHSNGHHNGTTIGISSISHNGNKNGNTIASTTHVVDGINVTPQLQIPLDVSLSDIAAWQPTPPLSPPSTPPTTTNGSLPSDLSDDASTLSSFDDDDDDDDDSEADDRTVVGPLDEYIEDVMIDGSDADNMLSCGEFYDGRAEMICDGDIDELIKQAEQIVRAADVEEDEEDEDADLKITDAAGHHWANQAAKHQPDRNESPRSSEDSGILENHDEAIASGNEDFDFAADDANVDESTLKCTLTEAVSRWLVEKQKEKSPEPIIRLPEDPALSTQIAESIQRFQIAEMLKSYAVDNDDDDDDYGDEDYGGSDVSELKPLCEPYTTDTTPTTTAKPAKNWQSNPLPVLSANQHHSSDAGKRVAFNSTNQINGENGATTHTTTTTTVSPVDEPDILEYWDVDPMLTQQQRRQQQHDGGANGGSNVNRGDATQVNYAQLLSEVGTRTTIDFLMSQQQQQTKGVATPDAIASNAPNAVPSQQQRIDPKSGEYLKRHQFGCALM